MKLEEALKEFKYQEVSKEELARFAQFSDEEIKMMNIFWDQCSDKGWFHLPRIVIKEWYCKEDNSKNSVYNFYRRTLFKYYEKDVDYKELERCDPLVMHNNFDTSEFFKGKKTTKASKKYYAVTNDCFKSICDMRNRSIYKTYAKIEKLIDFKKKYGEEIENHREEAEQSSPLEKAMVTFEYKCVSNEELAKYIGFNKREMNMMNAFWGPCFNKNWMYLYPEFIRDELGYKTTHDFYNTVLRNGEYKEEEDYKQVSKEHELVGKFYHDCNRDRKLPGNKASYYIITGKCLKLILMSLRTQIAVETRKYYIKVEELAIFMNDYTQELQKELYKKQLEVKDQLLIESKKDLEEEKNKNMKLSHFIDNVRVKEKEQIIYIAFG